MRRTIPGKRSSDDSHTLFGHTPAFKALQEFQKSSPYKPPSDDSLVKDIGKQIVKIDTQYARTSDLRAKAVGQEVVGRIHQFIGEAQSGASEDDLARREAMAQTFVKVLSGQLLPAKNTKTATLRLLSTAELLIVRSWFNDENDTTREIDALIAERMAKDKNG